MATIVTIINEMMAGDIDSYNLFKNKVMSYIDSHYPDISCDDYEDIFENIIENIVNNGGLRSNNPYQYIYNLIKRYNKKLEAENRKITELDEDIYYTEDLIFNQIYKTELMLRIHEVLNTLTERERTVIKYRFYRNYSLEETGEMLGVARERIRQIEAKALRKLRYPIRSKKIRDFLFNDYYCNINFMELV